MSSKAKTSRGDSKLPPIKETVLTRRQSSQQKRQLRNKASSIKRISQYTQLLLSPTKGNTSKSPPKKSKGNDSKNTSTVKTRNIKEKVQEQSDANNIAKKSPVKRDSKGKFIKKVKSPKKNVDTEYYPNKLKRSIEGKKVVLKPKHEMQVVVGTRIGKRKLVLPQKGESTCVQSSQLKHQKVTKPKSPKPKPHHVELTIEDMVRLHNDDMLDDEDWLEILTCPSPVWWEDPPDPGFDDEPVLHLPATTNTQDIQEPVRKRNKSNPKKTYQESHINITEVLSESNVKVLEMKKSDDKFMRKRSKLENLLGIIRNKVNDCIKSSHNNSKCSVKRKSDISIKKTEGNRETKCSSPVTDSKPNSPAPKKVKRTSESTEEDIFSNFRDDDLLNDLENIEIPIKSDEDEECEDKKVKSLCFQQNDTAEDSADCNSLQDKGSANDGSNSIVTYLSPRREKDEIAKINSQISKLTTTSIEKDVGSSPLSAKSVISTSDTYERCSVIGEDVDTISDTNIKFIDDDVSSGKSCEISEKKDNIDNIQAKTSSDANNSKLSNVESANKYEEVKKSCVIENVRRTYSNPRKEKDCMTVYKIISNEKDNSETNNKDNKNNSVLSKINELIKASKEYNSFKANLQSNEPSKITELIKASKEYNSFKANLQTGEASKTKLDLFYKKFKNHQSRQIKRPETVNNNSINTDNNDSNIKNNDKINLKTNTNDRITIDNENKNELDIVKENTQNSNENQNNNEEKSIIVPNSSTAIKYCLKCSCIFDTNNCNYCVEKAKNSTDNHNSLCKNSMKSSNSEKSKDVESFLCDKCKNKNDD